MKKLALILLTLAVVACTSKGSDEEQLREMARKDIIEKLELPEGTEFTDQSIEVNKNSEIEDGPNVEWIVKVTVKSGNREGEEIIKTHIMHYKKRADAEAAKDRFELISFE